MAWGQRTVEDRVFTVRTILWGNPTTQTVRSWPIMEPGIHLFPFTCAMPNVNYPPSSLNNPLVNYAFHLVATLERPGLRPFQTEACPVLFQPRIMTAVVSSAFQEERQLGPVSVTVALPTMTFHIGDIVRVHIRSTDVIHVSVALEQHFKVTTSTFHHSKTMVVKHVERRMDQGDILIPLDEGIAPVFNYGRKVDMRYQIKIITKSRQGTLQTKKKTFHVPVYIGTTPEASEDLVLPYTDEIVVRDTTLRTKPKFLRHQAEPLPLLPAYDANSPPKYCS
ncbi:hypothetical protein BJV82DRAFT_605268 [Fennellomyces sp. T-0311]|nr:hypothetical protein BJV82DRAFT_605268 [Fennellomyces sp. T-0311]